MGKGARLRRHKKIGKFLQISEKKVYQLLRGASYTDREFPLWKQREARKLDIEGRRRDV